MFYVRLIYLNIFREFYITLQLIDSYLNTLRSTKLKLVRVIKKHTIKDLIVNNV
jgi:hypothetical protein